MVEIRAAAAGRVRFRVHALVGDPERIEILVRRIDEWSEVRGSRGYARTGSVVVWVSSGDGPDLADRVTLALSELPRQGSHPARRRDEPERGEMTRLVVGGAVLVALAVRRVVLRRSSFLSPRGRAVAGVVTLFTGYPFFRGAARAVTGGRPGGGTDLLVSAATLASLVLRESVVALTVLWLLTIGEYLQALTLRRTRRAIADLVSLGSGRTWLVTADGDEVEVATDDLGVGDVVAVYERSVLPVDGVVVSGEAVVDQAAVTGESLPVLRGTGDPVYAGTLLVQGALRVRASSVGADTTVARLIARVEEAQADRAPIATVAARFTRRFVPASFVLAGVTWALTGDARRAMTMLLVACPCAAGLSTPTAVSAAIGNGARRGMLIKGGSHLEAAGRVDTVVFDKTGTLTVGRPLVTDVVAFASGWSPERVLAYAASSEVHVHHPLAEAVVRHTNERHIEIPVHEECEVLLGLGMRVVAGGDRLLLGSPRLMRRFGVDIPEEAARWIDRLGRDAVTPICLAHHDALVGLLGVTDVVRAEAAEVTEELRRIGIERVIMLTGDTDETGRAVARQLGVDEWQARVLPEDKLEAVRALQREGHLVAVVGDGINDAPALAAADVGIAMGISTTDLAVETADVALAGNELRHVVGVIDLGRQTLRVVLQNYALSIGVNTLGLLAGTFGSLNPVLAAVLHNASSVAVVLNSARLVSYDPARSRLHSSQPRPRPRPGGLPGGGGPPDGNGRRPAS